MVIYSTKKYSRNPLIIISTNVMSPKTINFQGINLSFTIPNMNNEESKISIWPKIEMTKGTMQLAKIKEALDLQIPLFKTEDQRCGKSIRIILPKFMVQYHNHHIYGISYITNYKSATDNKLWKALETKKNKKRCN